MRETWVAAHGAWSDGYDDLLALNPGFFERLLALSAHPWRHGVLEPKIKELVLLSVDAATTHLYAPGVREHVQRALELGATPAEVMEVLELVIGAQAFAVAGPPLQEALERAGIDSARKA